MKNNKTLKRIWSMFLTLAMVLTLSVTALPVYAAEGGNISVNFSPGVEGLTSTTFNVYKVGHFGRGTDGKVTIEPDDIVIKSGVDQSIFNIPSPEKDWTEEQIAEWEKSWLDAAATLKPYVGDYEPVNTAPVNAPADQITTLANVSENGIYLIVGDEQKVKDDYWWPLPVLTMVLNGDSTYTFDSAHVSTKMDSKPVVYTHHVTKSWTDNDNKVGMRPESIQVEIMYGSNKIDTVTLNDGNNWTYTWKTTESGDKLYYNEEEADTAVLNKDNGFKYKLIAEDIPEGDHSWTAREVFAPENKNLYNYYVQEPPQVKGTEIEDFTTLSNKFDKYSLIINKDLKSYADMGSGSNASVVFEVTGFAKNAEGKEVEMYHTQTGLVFDKPGKDSVRIDNIPVHLSKLVVKELYSANYKPASGTTDEIELTTIPSEDKTYTADFTNEHNGGGPVIYTGSVVNKYTKGDSGYTYTGIRGLAQ